MYSDRVEAENGLKKTVKNRLNGGSGDFSTRGRQITSTNRPFPRERQDDDDDKWEHDLFDDDRPRISNPKVDPRDLRLKLQKKQHGLQSGSLGVGDLREKLSGTMNSQPRISREAARPPVKKTKSETRTALNKATKKANGLVDSFLESLGLEKYSTAFQVEEVDMDALIHMTDDDLKAMLIPVGPRKKILLALGSKR